MPNLVLSKINTKHKLDKNFIKIVKYIGNIKANYDKYEAIIKIRKKYSLDYNKAISILNLYNEYGCLLNYTLFVKEMYNIDVVPDFLYIIDIVIDIDKIYNEVFNQNIFFFKKSIIFIRRYIDYIKHNGAKLDEKSLKKINKYVITKLTNETKNLFFNRAK